jgi:membrane protease YdiL (CAAX protease family)
MITNRQLILPYAAPYLAYVGIGSLPDGSLAPEVNYLLRLIVVPLLLCWAWRWYCPLLGPRSPQSSIVTGAAAGLLGLVIWIALLAPFVHPEASPSWSTSSFLLRLLSAGMIVPIFEELMMRGFLFRLALQWDTARKNKEENPLHIALDQRSVNEIAPGSWSWPAVALSTLAFTSGHLVHEWPAAVAYGLFMAFLWTIRKDLLTCITAHAVTNIALAVYVYTTGQWQYW